MNKKRLLVLVGLFALNKPTFAQENTDGKIKKLKLSGISLSTGSANIPSHRNSIADFKKLAPGSILLQNDFTGFTQYSYMNYNYNNGNNYYSGYNNSGGVSYSNLSATFKIANKQKTEYKKHEEFRIGLSYYSVDGSYLNLNKSTYTVVDTLTSSHTGQQTFIDSINSKNYNMYNNYNQLRLDIALILKSKQFRRWQFYSGISVNAGVSINNTTDISYNEYNFGGYTNYYDYLGKGENEHYNNKINFGSSVYIPLGVDFTIGKKREFWKHVHLTYEIKPSLNLQTAPELNINNIFVNTQEQIGIKFSF